AADAGLETPGGHRNLLTDLQGGLLPLNGAQLRLLDGLGVAVVEQRVERGVGDGDREVAAAEMGQLVERGRVGGGCSPGAVGIVAVVVVVIAVAVGGGGGGRLQADAEAGGRQQAQVLGAIAVDLQNAHVHHHFRRRLVQVV